MRMINQCPICNSNKLIKLKSFKYKFPGDNIDDHLQDYDYTRLWILYKKFLKDKNDRTFYSMLCDSCGFIFINPRLSEEEMMIKYKTLNELRSNKVPFSKNTKINLDKRANRIYKLLNKHFNFKYNSLEKPQILDYGGAWGQILSPFIDKFNCYILDYDKWILPQGINYLGKDLSDLSNSKYQFDIINLLHTLEHVVYPKKLLKDLCAYLKDSGLIYIEVPLGCFKEWTVINEPISHINYFSEESLYKLLKICNLEVIYLKTSYQWVIRGKNLCVKIIGTKQKSGDFIEIKNVLSTNAQMSKINYYFKEFLDWRKFSKNYKIIIKKLKTIY